MARLCYLASVTVQDIQQCRIITDARVIPSRVIGCSQLLAMMNIAPLGAVLTDAIDGGAELAVTCGHRAKPPRWHNPMSVAAIDERFENCGLNLMILKWESRGYYNQIDKVVSLFRHATEQNECVIAAVEGDSIVW